MTTGTTAALELAESWRSRGIPVFPCRLWHDGSKVRKGTFERTHGFRDASTDVDRVSELFESVSVWGGSVVGVGLHLGPAGLLAVDIDGAEGLAAWRDDEHVPTFEVSTPSGGRHFWYRKPEAVNVGHSERCLPGVDVVRSDDGFVVAPGTVTPWGEWVSFDDWPESVAVAPPEVWAALDRVGGAARSSGAIKVRGLDAVLVELEREGRDRDAEALVILCSERYGGHHPWIAGSGEIGVVRPGKRAGRGASIGYAAEGVVKVFSTGWGQGGLAAHGRYVVERGELVPCDEFSGLIGGARPGAPSGEPGEKPLPLGLLTTRLSTIEPEAVSWIWHGYVPLGKITMLDGMPDLGKSTIAVDLASRVTTGADMPDGSTTGLDGPGDVVMFTAEDGLADTVRPRVDAAGGDPARIHVVRAVVARGTSGEPIERWPTLSADVLALESAVVDLGARLVVVDVLMAYLGSEVNSYRDQDMRAVLSPLAAMAERVGCAVMLLRHPTKAMNPDPVLSGGGSIGIAGAARVGLLVAFDPDDQAPPNDRRRLVAVSKCNIAAKAPTMAYRITQRAGAFAAHISWEGTTEHRAEQLIPSGGGRADSSTTDIVRQLMADLPMLALEAQHQCRLAGIKPDTALRVLKKLGGCSKKLSGDIAGGPNLGWAWFATAPLGDDIAAMRAEATRRKADDLPEGAHLYKRPSSEELSAFREIDDPTEVEL